MTGATPKGLQSRLEKLHSGEEKDFGGHGVEIAMSNNGCIGSDTILTYATDILVRDQLIPEVKLLLASVIFPLFYIGVVFLCVAVTVLSVQQLSDSAKYRQRYDVLKKTGAEESRNRKGDSETAQLILSVSGAAGDCNQWKNDFASEPPFL